MLGNSLSYALKVEETKYLERFKGFVTAQAAEMELSYFITCYYGRSFDGNFLTGDERQRRWDWGEVVKTHAFIKKQIHKCFGPIPIVFTIERHNDQATPDGDLIKGSYHTHLYMGGIDDDTIENPNPNLARLFYFEDDIGVPINTRVVNVDNLKILLLNACIRQAKWIGKHPNALDIQHIEPSEFERTFHYGLKQIQSEDDLNKVIDWTNSDFYNPTTKEKIK